MKYYLLNGNGLMWLRYRNTSADGVKQDWSCDCPYHHDDSDGCGSWCPLFEVRHERIDKTDYFRDSVHLHCGAGTRVIGIERSET